VHGGAVMRQAILHVPGLGGARRIQTGRRRDGHDRSVAGWAFGRGVTRRPVRRSSSRGGGVMEGIDIGAAAQESRHLEGTPTSCGCEARQSTKANRTGLVRSRRRTRSAWRSWESKAGRHAVGPVSKPVFQRMSSPSKFPSRPNCEDQARAGAERLRDGVFGAEMRASRRGREAWISSCAGGSSRHPRHEAAIRTQVCAGDHYR